MDGIFLEDHQEMDPNKYRVLVSVPLFKKVDPVHPHLNINYQRKVKSSHVKGYYNSAGNYLPNIMWYTGGFDVPAHERSSHWRTLNLKRHAEKISEIKRNIDKIDIVVTDSIAVLWIPEKKRRINEQLENEKSFWKRVKIRVFPENVTQQDRIAFLDETRKLIEKEARDTIKQNKFFSTKLYAQETEDCCRQCITNTPEKNCQKCVHPRRRLLRVDTKTVMDGRTTQDEEERIMKYGIIYLDTKKDTKKLVW